MEKMNLDYDLPQVKFVLVEGEQGFAVCGGPVLYTYAGGEEF